MSPLISIGLPVYNGEMSIETAIVAIRSQTYSNFELIISDNASTDKTEDICKYHATKDRRIKYVKHEVNMGPIANFAYVLNCASSPYFMWAADDDTWMPSFLEKNLEVLEKYPEVVASISRVKMPSILHKSPTLVNTYPIRQKRYIFRLRSFLRSLRANSRFYSIYRTSALQRSFVGENFMGGMDVATIVNVLRYGEFYELDEVLMERSCNGVSSELLTEQFARYSIAGMEKLFPFYKFTLWLWQIIGPVNFICCIDAIIKVNLFFSLVVIAEWTSIRKPKTNA